MAVILGDDYAHHRKWWDPFWEPDPALVGVWTPWDFALLHAYQLHEDFTSGESGQWLPFDASPEVDWEVHTSYSGYMESVEKYQKEHKDVPGERLYATPVFRDEEHKPTIEDYLKIMEEERETGQRARKEEYRDARPPTAAELAALTEAFKASKNAS